MQCKKTILLKTGIKVPCYKCIACRLNRGREKAVRAYHEAKTHESSLFLTLTYSPDNLKSDRLQYSDFQKFIRKLRKHSSSNIGYMVTGEYGENTKRPHWHCILFNYSPEDPKRLRTTKEGDTIFTAPIFEEIWPHGLHEYGTVTLESAGYVASYAAKKLVHGKDQNHNYHPIHKTSKIHTMGKKWIQENWKHVLNIGHINLPNGGRHKIPRYYLDYIKENHPTEYEKWRTSLREEQIKKAKEQNERNNQLQNDNTGFKNLLGKTRDYLLNKKHEDKMKRNKIK